MEQIRCEGCGVVIEAPVANQRYCKSCAKAYLKKRQALLRSGKRTSTVVRFKLEHTPPEVVENEMARKVLLCYQAMSEEGKEGVEEMITMICAKVSGPFGEIGALELIGSLMEAGVMDDWVSEAGNERSGRR